MQPGDAVGVAAGDLLAVGALDLGAAARRRPAPSRAAASARACAARRPRSARGGRRRGAAASAAGGRARRPSARAPRRGRRARRPAARAPRPPPGRGAPAAGRGPPGPRAGAAEHRLGVEHRGLVAGDVPAGAGLAAAHGVDDLGQRQVGAVAERGPLATGRGARGAARPSRDRPGRPPTSGRRSACAARGRARWPSTAKRAALGGAAGERRSSSSRSSRRRATSRASGPTAGDRPRRVERLAQALGAGDWPAASTRHQRVQGSSGSARSRATAAAAGWSSASSVAASPVAARGESPIAEEAASSATWRQRLSVPRAGAGPAAAMKGSIIRGTVAERERMLAAPGRRRARRARAAGEPARGRVEPLPAPARREPGGLVPVGRRGARARRAPRTGRSCCRSATRRATGAT